jgi:hypothetical protein
MARKTRVSFIRGMIFTAAKKELMPESIQIEDSDAGTVGTGLKLSIMRDKHAPRTASHKPAKKATTHGYV